MGDVVGTGHQLAGGGRYLGGRIAYLMHEFGKLDHHLVEYGRSLSDLILAPHFQAAAEIAFTGGNGAQTDHHLLDRIGDHAANEIPDEGQQQQTGGKRHSQGLQLLASGHLRHIGQ